ncbi:MAG: hypothetical protein KKA54_14105 [Proteobacteria bacterium]|nr:hypothetical protein [Pseudomonadota bacterium]
MKYLWVSSVFMAGLILSGGNAFAQNGNIHGRAQNLSESRLLLADASLDLDITMEVVDEDVQSSKDITNVIELPLRSRNQEMERHQKQLGNGPEFSNGPGEGKGHGPNPFLEGNPESKQQIERPDDTGRADSGGPDSGGPGSGGPGSGGRPDIDSSVDRGNIEKGPAGNGAKDPVLEKPKKGSNN